MNWTLSTEEPESSLYFTCTQTPESPLKQYQEVRSFSEKLCEPLTTEDHVVQSMEDVSHALGQPIGPNPLKVSSTRAGAVKRLK